MTSEDTFRKSTRSELHGSIHCVEVGQPGPIAIRDTKEDHMGDDRTVISVSPSAWKNLLGSLQ